MLRTRILLIALGIVTLIVGLFGYGAWLRERAAENEHDRLRLALMGQAWALVSQAAIDQTAALTLGLFDHQQLIEAIRQDSQAQVLGVLGRPLEEAVATTDLVRFDLYSAEADLLFSSDAIYFASRLFGTDQPVPLDRTTTLSGIRINDDQVQGLSVVPLFDGDQRVATAVITIDLTPGLALLADQLAADVVVLDRSGAPVQDLGANAYATVLKDIDPVRPQLVTQRLDDKTLELTTAIAVDVGGGRSATVIAIQDISTTAGQGTLAVLVTVFWTLLAALVPLGLLWLYLSRAFRPLDDAIDALSQLSQGRTDHYAELRSGDDEIGQIGRAIEVFRDNTLQIERLADLEERRRRRQARFLRRQMTSLGQTLDEEGRASAMEDLRQIELTGAESDPAAGQDAPAFSDQLGLIGIALERMTARVRSQQEDMNALIAELREALALKTRLISLEQELEVARQMQQNILPRAFPALPGFTLAAQMRPAREVGGDFYDVFRIDDRRTAIAIADVSGKGVPAAFFMLITRTLLKALALEGRGPARTVARLNELLSGENEEMMFVTLFYAELDPLERRLTYANCGHNEPILVSGGSAVPLPSTGGVALAVQDDLAFEERTIEMAANSTLVLFTDGVTEAFDSDGHMFSDHRLIGLLDDLQKHDDASTMLTDILQAVDQFSGDAPQSDDITLMVLSALGHEVAQTASGRQRRVAAAE
jgi:phosphoserine phosphatase RsbU/P